MNNNNNNNNSSSRRRAGRSGKKKKDDDGGDNVVEAVESDPLLWKQQQQNHNSSSSSLRNRLSPSAVQQQQQLQLQSQQQQTTNNMNSDANDGPNNPSSSRRTMMTVVTTGYQSIEDPPTQQQQTTNTSNSMSLTYSSSTNNAAQQQGTVESRSDEFTTTTNSSASSSITPPSARHQHHQQYHMNNSNTTPSRSTTISGSSTTITTRGGGGQPQQHQQHQRDNNGNMMYNHQQHQRNHNANTETTVDDNNAVNSPTSTMQQQQQPPLLEIPEEIYAVRKAALQVLKPLNKTWVVISVGFALTVLFGMARWTRLLPMIPYWFIILPCWSSHMGLLWLHILSAQALSNFIAEANESRQRPDSRDHLNRTEYLPLLQRSLKFGLKTGLLSFCVFGFEVLMYIKIAKNSISLAAAFLPLWILVSVGILDGLICKTQHPLRVVCWMLSFLAMILTVAKVDHNMDGIRWRVVVSPIIAVLSIGSCSLIYIVYGHQIGYYRLTESQLTAGNLYSLAALICIVLIVIIGEVIPLSRPVEIETRLLVVILAPLVVCLVGMGAWVVSRDEFGRLLLYGGQSAVHPMKLRWEANNGWTSVQGRGVTVIPMFGEVAFQPLEKKPMERAVEMLTCCTGTCYPYEEEEDNEEERVVLGGGGNDVGSGAYHPYLDPSSQRAYNVRATTGV